jgi:hypothetical protein
VGSGEIHPAQGSGYAIDFLDIESGRVIELFEERGGQAFDLSVSPDEEWILYGRRPVHMSELMLMENFR